MNRLVFYVHSVIEYIKNKVFSIPSDRTSDGIKQEEGMELDHPDLITIPVNGDYPIDESWFPSHGLNQKEYSAILKEAEKAWRRKGFAIVLAIKETSNRIELKTISHCFNLGNVSYLYMAYRSYKNIWDNVSIRSFVGYPYNILTFIHSTLMTQHHDSYKNMNHILFVKLFKLIQELTDSDSRIFICMLEPDSIFIYPTSYIKPGNENLIGISMEQFDKIVYKVE